MVQAHTTPDDAQPAPPHGRIDIHSHLIPGRDDGCIDLEESIKAIAMLKAAGFVGTVCTSHVWDTNFPDNQPAQVVRWGDELRAELNQRGIDYPVWTGGEVRIFPGCIELFQERGVPVLARSNCVLCDFWDQDWSDWIDRVFQWLLLEGFKPILAHPERVMCCRDVPRRLKRLREMGVMLQGNARSMTGHEGPAAAEAKRDWLDDDLYHFVALDMHRTDQLPSRFDGVDMLKAEYGDERAKQLIEDAPRQWVLP